MKSSKIIKKESMDLIAERPTNFLLSALLCSIVLILMTIDSGDNIFSSDLFKVVINYDPILSIIMFLLNTSFCYFIMANYKRWHKKNVGTIESVITTLKEMGAWETIIALLFVWIANMILLGIGTFCVLGIIQDGNRIFSFGYGLILGIIIIVNLLLFMFKYALIDQYNTPSSLSNKYRFKNISLSNKVYNAINISASLMTDTDFLWQWFKLTATSLLWASFSLIFYNVPMIVAYPYIVLCYVKLYYAGVAYLKTKADNHEIAHLKYAGAKNVSLEAKSTHPFKDLSRELNNGMGTKMLITVRKYKSHVKHYFAGPSEAEEKQAEKVLKNNLSNKTPKSKKQVKAKINKAGLAKVNKIKNKQGQQRAKINQPTTNPKDNKKVMRTNNERE